MKKDPRTWMAAIGVLSAVCLLGSTPALSAPAATSAKTAAVPATTWSTASRSAGPTGAPIGQVVTNTRGTGGGVDAASGRTFDRVVVDTVSATTSRRVGFLVRYVPQVRADGSGQVLSLSGAYKLEVIVRAPAHNNAGQSTYHATFNRDLPGVSDGVRVVDTVYGGSFEGQTTIGVGLNARKAFRVLQLADGRIALDISRR